MTTVDVSATEAPGTSAQRARISFRQPVSVDGFVDAAWWPRSFSLTDELPGLFELFWTADRQINRITFNSTVWDAAPHKLTIDGRLVHLGGFTTSDTTTVRLSDAWQRERIDVVVIAPDTDPDLAERIMQVAARAGSDLRPAQVLEQARAQTPTSTGAASTG